MFPFLLTLFVLIMAGGLWWTLLIAKKQKTYTKDEVNATLSRHKVLLNPIYLTYIGFGVLGIIIIYIAFFVFKKA